MAFYNKLNYGYVEALLRTGDPSGLAVLSNSTQLTIPSLRAIAARSSPFDILRVVAPDRAMALSAALRQISELADYTQSVCGYLAANDALEPAHDVICRLFQSGANFGHAVRYNPIQMAAAAVAPLCHQPDVDGTLKRSPGRNTAPLQNRRRQNTSARNSLNYCYSFQEGRCAATNCRYRHVCA